MDKDIFDKFLDYLDYLTNNYGRYFVWASGLYILIHFIILLIERGVK